MSFYTGKGDDGTTGLLYGGRASKDDVRFEAVGALDEAQAAVGAARAECERGSELDELLVAVERDLYVLMAEVATLPENRHKLTAGASLVTPEMVDRLGAATDDLSARFEMPSEFVIPGQDRTSALLEVARTAIRRAERRTVTVAAAAGDSSAVPYHNRRSSLLWAAARWQEGEHLAARTR